MELYIGNKNYSTWSLRAWLFMEQYDLDFTEKLLSLDTPEFYSELKEICPSVKVPCLVDDELVIWDSLAICEYINEAYLDGKGWPTELSDRTIARSLSSEMHSGFLALRHALPMNIRAIRRIILSEDVQADIQRIEDIFSSRMLANGKQYRGWLFGEFSIADAMFAPIVLRFKTYKVKLNMDAQRYADFVLESDTLNQWVKKAKLEKKIVEADEAGEPIL